MVYQLSIDCKMSILNIFKEENALEKLSQLGDVNLTVASTDFLELVNKFEWDENEREEFIENMLGLTPNKRKTIMNHMIEELISENNHIGN